MARCSAAVASAIVAAMYCSPSFAADCARAVAGLHPVAEGWSNGILLDPDSLQRPGAVVWVCQLGTSNDDLAYHVATDSGANVLIAGITQGLLDGTHLDEQNGDVFVAKYGPSGTLLWKRQLGTYENDAAWSVATDTGRNVLIAGYTGGSLDGTNQGDGDAFVAKYSPSGTLMWKHQFGTPDGDEALGVATDGQRNVLVVGSTAGSLKGINQGSVDAYVAKYTRSGKLLWMRQLGTSGDDKATGVSADATGNVFIGGYTSGSLDGQNQGSLDAFVAKYSPSGTLLWMRQLGTSDIDAANGVATDTRNNVVIAGATGGSLGGTNQGYGDAFVAKYSPSGNLMWKHQLGTPEGEAASGVATDADRNVVIAGGTIGSLGGQNQGQADAFVVKYSPLGKLLWKREFGTPDYETPTSVATDPAGNILIAGETDGSIGGPNQGKFDAFLAKLAP